MKIDLIWVGKTTDSYTLSAVDEYAKRLSKYARFEIREIRNIKKKVSANELKLLEAAEILKFTEAYEKVILLDEGGKQFSSTQFASKIENLQINGIKSLCFVIGGAYGYSEELRSKYELFSLSKMTFSHQLIRVIFLEQL